MHKQSNRIIKKKFNLTRKSLKQRYIGTFKKTVNNIFVTIMNMKGEVILSNSAGTCKIKTKKKKRSFDTVKAIALSIAKASVLKNIKFIEKFYVTHKYLKNMKLIVNTFRFNGLMVKELVYVKTKPHSLPLRKKKIRRI